MEKALTVTQFVELVNAALLALEKVTVEGEVVEYKVIQGKWVVFDLKDEESLVKCFMPIWQLTTSIEDGMLVRAVGQPRLRNKGFFSFVVESVRPTGEGSLRRAFELLKKKLETEGLFAQPRKRSLPRFPQHIVLITSRDAAAYSDFLKVLRARQGGLAISFIHAQVQGEEAPARILEALERANTIAPLSDVIVMVRGGGSLEDLQAFNDERVVRAVAASRVPTIVGIGHERDVTLAELAADVRASTPSNAAELAVRSRDELSTQVRRLQQRFRQSLQEALHYYQRRIQRSLAILRGAMGRPREHVRSLRYRLSRTMTDVIVARRTHLVDVVRLVQSLSPQKILARGFSITRTAKGKLITHASQIKKNEVLISQLKEGSITSRAADRPSPQLELGV